MMGTTLHIHRGNAEARRFDELTDRAIGAIEVHRKLGPGLLESAYELTGMTYGLLVNFHVAVLKDGLKRIVNQFPDISASPRLRGSTNV